MDFLEIFQGAMSAQFGGGNWWQTCAIALGISAAVTALGWAIAEAIGKAELRSWARKELGEFTFSCVIMVAIVILLPTMYIISMSITPNNADFNVVAEKFFAESSTKTGVYYLSLSVGQQLAMKGLLYELYGDLRMNLTAVVKLLAKFIPVVGRFAFIIPDIIVKPLGAADDISSGIDPYTGFAYLAALLSLAQLELLRFVKSVALQYLLPLGVVMRTFPLTRKTGSTMIALALVGAVVYPLSIVLSSTIYNEAAPSIGVPQLPFTYLPQIGVLVESPQDGAKVTTNDTITWSLSSSSGSYRIWQSDSDSGCSSCPSATCSNDLQPPDNPSIEKWYSNATMHTCLKLATSGTLSSDTVTAKIADILPPDGGNDLYSFVLDAYNGTQALGWAEAKLVVGDPCANNVWTAMRCWMGHQYTISYGSASSSLSTLGSVTFMGLIETLFQEGFGTAGLTLITQPWKVPATNYLVAHIFLNISEKLPSMMFPPFMATFSIVISGFVCVSMFRSISTAIGGEAELPGLAKVL